MPKRLKSNPKYYKHKASGQAVVSIDGQDFYLGPWKSRASRDAYDRLIGEYLANGRRLRPRPDDLTVGEVIERFWEYAQAYYRRPDGTRTQEVGLFKNALDPLNRLYGPTPAFDFGPKKLEAVRNAMVEKDWSRGTINKAVNRVRAMFNWAVAQELIPASNLAALKALKGLCAGRTNARETAPVQPVSDAVVDATLPFLSPTVRAMVQLQRLTGARPGEICKMRTVEIDCSESEWKYTPASHKNSHRGQQLTIFIGSKGQEILRPFLRFNGFCFSPRQSERDRREAMRSNRKTPLHYGNGPGTNVKRKPKCAPGECYTKRRWRPLNQRYARERLRPARGRKCRNRTGADGNSHVALFRGSR
jgi:integrase